MSAGSDGDLHLHNTNNHDDSNYSNSHFDIYYDLYQDCGMATIPEFREFQASEMLETWLYPLLIVLGLVGNGLSLVVLRYLSDNAWSSCLYLTVLSGVELVVLIIRCGMTTWFPKVSGIKPSRRIMDSSDAMCKMYLFVLNVLLQMWPWLMVALSVELVISTRYPLKTYHLCTTERAKATILLISIILICLNLNYFWTWGLGFGDQCLYVEVFSSNFLNIIWPSIATTVQHILPLLVVIVAFFLSLISLLNASRSSAPSYEPILKKYFLDLQALQQLKHVALITVLLFLIVKLFTFGVELLNALELRGVITVPCDQYAQFRARFKLVQTLRDAVVYCFHSLKFFVYFALCARFRQRVSCIVRRVFLCGKADERGRKSRVAKSNEDSRLFEQMEDRRGHGDHGQNNSYSGPRDLNGHNSTAFSKTTHV